MKRKALLKINIGIEGNIYKDFESVLDRIRNADFYNSYIVLEVRVFYHVWVNHSQLFARGRNHINRIESFWNQAKRHLRKFYGIPWAHFRRYLRNASGVSTTQSQKLNYLF